MKITTNEGEFELIAVSDDANFTKVYGLKPVKKTEKHSYTLQFGTWEKGETLFADELDPTTANKLSEAISATVYLSMNKPKLEAEAKFELLSKIDEARKSYLESQ